MFVCEKCIEKEYNRTFKQGVEIDWLIYQKHYGPCELCGDVTTTIDYREYKDSEDFGGLTVDEAGKRFDEFSKGIRSQGFARHIAKLADSFIESPNGGKPIFVPQAKSYKEATDSGFVDVEAWD